MADFNPAVILTLKHEGGYTDNPNDPGGATNMGITQADMPGVNLRTLTSAQAAIFYCKKFWNPIYNEIVNQSVANKLFDLGVLFGIGAAVEILQQVLGIKMDGNFGPVTLQAVNASDSVSLLLAYRTAMVARAVAIGASRPAERVFVAGWINRINS